jgi:hypothetical protein
MGDSFQVVLVVRTAGIFSKLFASRDFHLGGRAKAHRFSGACGYYCEYAVAMSQYST